MKLNGVKLLDNAYFGARYYDNTTAMWLGVDSLWEKYEGMKKYHPVDKKWGGL